MSRHMGRADHSGGGDRTTPGWGRYVRSTSGRRSPGPGGGARRRRRKAGGDGPEAAERARRDGGRAGPRSGGLRGRRGRRGGVDRDHRRAEHDLRAHLADDHPHRRGGRPRRLPGLLGHLAGGQRPAEPRPPRPRALRHRRRAGRGHETAIANSESSVRLVRLPSIASTAHRARSSRSGGRAAVVADCSVDDALLVDAAERSVLNDSVVTWRLRAHAVDGRIGWRVRTS